jgi:beta-1,4-mannosyl-glycoprotein beta-1,4-N-acetylglucosaminyltransferase
MRKIYDCFIFFNELDLLELRLNILNSYVDYFVICEASVTHSGNPKEFIFEKNKKRFDQFLHKIIHIKIDDIPTDFINLPNIPDIPSFDGSCVNDIHSFIKDTNLFNKITESHFGRDFFQKESLRRGLENCEDNDIVILSDCDEIPNPKVLEKVDKFINDYDFFTFNQKNYYYYINLFKEETWKGSRMGLYKNLKKYSFNKLRSQQNCEIKEGGWHFSFMGGSEQVKLKIKSYSHQELNTSQFIDNIENNMENNIDPFFRGSLKKVDIDSSYPEYILNNLQKYKHMIKE